MRVRVLLKSGHHFDLDKVYDYDSLVRFGADVVKFGLSIPADVIYAKVYTKRDKDAYKQVYIPPSDILRIIEYAP